MTRVVFVGHVHPLFDATIKPHPVSLEMIEHLITEYFGWRHQHFCHWLHELQNHHFIVHTRILLALLSACENGKRNNEWKLLNDWLMTNAFPFQNWRIFQFECKSIGIWQTSNIDKFKEIIEKNIFSIIQLFV